MQNIEIPMPNNTLIVGMAIEGSTRGSVRPVSETGTPAPSDIASGEAAPASSDRSRELERCFEGGQLALVAGCGARADDVAEWRDEQAEVWLELHGEGVAAQRCVRCEEPERRTARGR